MSKKEDGKSAVKAEAKAEAKAELAVVEAKPAELTKEEEVEGGKLYEKRIEEFKSQTMEVNKVGLQLNWEKGKFVGELLQDPKKYGNRTVENVAKSFEVSKELVYSWHRFHTRYTQEDVARCIKEGISYHNIFFLTSVLDADKRRELEDAIVSKKINAPQLQEAVKNYNTVKRKEAKRRGHKVDGRGGVTVSRVVKSTHRMCVDMARKLDEFGEALRDFRKMEDGQSKSAMVNTLKETKKAIEAMMAKGNKVLEKCEV